LLGEPGEISFDPGDIITNIDQIDEGKQTKHSSLHFYEHLFFNNLFFFKVGGKELVRMGPMVFFQLIMLN
jgi:hypothetical protein